MSIREPDRADAICTTLSEGDDTNNVHEIHSESNATTDQLHKQQVIGKTTFRSRNAFDSAPTSDGAYAAETEFDTCVDAALASAVRSRARTIGEIASDRHLDVDEDSANALRVSPKGVSIRDRIGEIFSGTAVLADVGSMDQDSMEAATSGKNFTGIGIPSMASFKLWEEEILSESDSCELDGRVLASIGSVVLSEVPELDEIIARRSFARTNSLPMELEEGEEEVEEHVQRRVAPTYRRSGSLAGHHAGANGRLHTIMQADRRHSASGKTSGVHAYTQRGRNTFVAGGC